MGEERLPEPRGPLQALQRLVVPIRIVTVPQVELGPLDHPVQRLDLRVGVPFELDLVIGEVDDLRCLPAVHHEMAVQPFAEDPCHVVGLPVIEAVRLPLLPPGLPPLLLGLLPGPIDTVFEEIESQVVEVLVPLLDMSAVLLGHAAGISGTGITI